MWQLKVVVRYWIPFFCAVSLVAVNYLLFRWNGLRYVLLGLLLLPNICNAIITLYLQLSYFCLPDSEFGPQVWTLTDWSGPWRIVVINSFIGDEGWKGNAAAAAERDPNIIQFLSCVWMMGYISCDETMTNTFRFWLLITDREGVGMGYLLICVRLQSHHPSHA